MQLSDEKIKKFQELYKQKFSEELSHEEAAEQYVKLVRLVQLVYVPITQEDVDALAQYEQSLLAN